MDWFLCDMDFRNEMGKELTLKWLIIESLYQKKNFRMNKELKN